MNADPRELWLDERRSGIGGSDAPVVAGVSPYKTLLQLYCDKLGISDPTEENEAMEWGNLLEDPVAQKYAKVTGRVLEYPGPFVIQRSEVYPWAICTIDRFVAADPRGRGVLQVKTTGFFHGDEWKEGPPDHVRAQIQHEMAVTGCEWGSVAVLIGGQKFGWCDVPRNQEYIDQLMEAERLFWERVQNQDPPPPDADDKATLAMLYPMDTGAVIELSGAGLDRDVALLQVKEEIKALEARKDELENLFRAELGDASIGVLPNGVKYTLKSQTRKSYTVPEATFRVLRRAAQK